MARLFSTLLLATTSLLVITCKKPVVTPEEALTKQLLEQINTIDGEIAVAFYENGYTLLINKDENFHAASTMKVPVMIELYKQAAQGNLNLKDSIVLKNEFKSIVDGSLYRMDINDDSADTIYNLIGKKVTLYNLMYSMITMSSNLATNVLIELVDAKKVTATMRDLGAKNIEVLRGVEDLKAYDLGMSNTTTAKDLMIIMKAIANHTAGNPEDCEAMIAILKQQHFNEIIPKHLPQEVVIAHKTGSITGVHHDAGIIYLPNGKYYVLVLLSKNLNNFEQGTAQLADISKTVYDYIQKKEETVLPQ